MSISQEDRTTLLRLAREAVSHVVSGTEAPFVGQPTGVLAEQRGCFVTLTNRGRLRGCIGTFAPAAPLAQSVVQMGMEAARDPRFLHRDPITPGELSELEIEISVLSPLTPIEDPLSLEVGTHGIYIQRGPAGGCFLPEVATDQGWNAEQFLSYCCAHKAGLPPDAWRDPRTTVLVFTSEKFGG